MNAIGEVGAPLAYGREKAIAGDRRCTAKGMLVGLVLLPVTTSEAAPTVVLGILTVT